MGRHEASGYFGVRHEASGWREALRLSPVSSNHQLRHICSKFGRVESMGLPPLRPGLALLLAWRLVLAVASLELAHAGRPCCECAARLRLAGVLLGVAFVQCKVLASAEMGNVGQLWPCAGCRVRVRWVARNQSVLFRVRAREGAGLACWSGLCSAICCKMLANGSGGHVQRHRGGRVHARWLARAQGVLSRPRARERAGGACCGGLASERGPGEPVGLPHHYDI